MKNVIMWTLLSDLARRRLAELEAEEESLRKFINSNTKPQPAKKKKKTRKQAKGHTMSEEARALISKRQKAYWKRWRKEQKKKKGV